MKIEIYEVAVGPPEQEFRPKEWRWRLKARNGKILASGESYKRQATMLRVLDTVFECRDSRVIPIVEVVEEVR